MYTPIKGSSDSLDTIDASLRTSPGSQIPCMSMQEVTQPRKEEMSTSQRSGQEYFPQAKKGGIECSSPGLSRPQQRILAQNGCLKAGAGDCVVPETI